MPLAGIGIFWPWLAVLSLLTLLGLFLLWRGLRPRREGNTPYCHKCGYNLTGSDRDAHGTRCPECGTDVTSAGAVVFGERHVRPRRALIGVICLLLGLAPLPLFGVAALRYRQVGWYRLKPTALVLRDLQSGNVGLVDRAAKEISRRINSDSLSDAQIGQLAEACLAEQSRPNLRGLLSTQLINLLGPLCERDLLTADQFDRFCENICVVELRVRPTVIRDREFPVMLAFDKRTPDSGAWIRVKHGEIRLDGQVMKRRSGMSTLQGTSATGISTGVRASAVGRQQLSADFELQVCAGTRQGGSEDVKVLRTIPRTLTAALTVLEEEPADYITLTRSPDLDLAIECGVHPQGVQVLRASNDGQSRQLRCWIQCDAGLPIGLAFEVGAEFGEKSLHIGSVTWPAGLSIPRLRVLTANLPGQPPDTVDLVLKPSRKAAARSADLFEIWGGELRFYDVFVEQSLEADPAIHRPPVP